MATDGVKRKPSAILGADVKGYSRLMEEDELKFCFRGEQDADLLQKLRELF